MTRAERPTFSVIVVSRDRPTWLRRCITSLKQLEYPAFEIVVVAERNNLIDFDQGFSKLCTFDDANISAARNLGIETASGEICAFIDDDAVAEPRWLRHLAEAFKTTKADAAVGFVRGRNGISFQSRASSVDVEAETHVESLVGESPTILTLGSDRATKLIGTNMAVKRDVLIELGGFDEAFRFFLEDADLSLRLQRTGKKVAVVPLAEVHHGFAPSVRRTARRAPLDLFDIGRSTRYFVRKHGQADEQEIWERIESRETARMVKHMVWGTCEPTDVVRRLETLRKGWDDPLPEGKSPVHEFGSPITPFRPAEVDPVVSEVIASPLWLRRHRVLKMARSQAESGKRVSVFSFSLTPARHHVRYVEPGIWIQSGGLYGKSDRSDPWFKWCRFADRLRREIRRVAKQRGIGEIVQR